MATLAPAHKPYHDSMPICPRLLRIALLLPLVLAAAACGPLTFTVGAGPGDMPLTATVVQRDPGFGSSQVALIDITGTLTNSQRKGLLSSGDNPVSFIHEQLERARHDRRVKAVILRINSPGGTVTASDLIYREVQRFEQDTGKPVIALLMDVAASGGFYVACSAQKIIAHPTSITGSIGVIMQLVSLRPALNRIGIEPEAIVSGPNKAAGSPLETLSPQQRALFQTMVDDFYHRFVAVVQQARPQLSAEDLPRVTDGRVLTGDQAAACGLVDQTGDLQDAFTLAKQLARVQRANLVRYHRPLQYVGSPYASAPAGAGRAEQTTQINLLQVNLPENYHTAPVTFSYLWEPTLQP